MFVRKSVSIALIIFSSGVLMFFGLLIYQDKKAQEAVNGESAELPENLQEALGQSINNNLSKDTVVSKTILIASVDIYEPKIIKQEENNFDLSFLIINIEESQPDIRYAIQLFSKDSKELVDENVYSEVVSLEDNSEVVRKIHYQAPGYLKGIYELRVISKNGNGLMLGSNSFGEVTLAGDENYLEILLPSCYLTIKGDEIQNEYTLSQGIDIKSDEYLELNCDLKNHSDSDLVVTPITETFYRTSFGQKVEATDVFSTEKFKFEIKSLEQKSISFLLPKTKVPQSYDIKIEFQNDLKIPSEKIAVHYVLSGKAATITNLLSDKSFYNKNDIAQLSFFVSGPADSFYGSRLGATKLEGVIANIQIKDENDKACGNEMEEAIDFTQIKQLIPFQITADCQSPKIKVDLIDKTDSSVLNSYEFGLVSSKNYNDQAVRDSLSTGSGINSFLIILILILILIPILIIFVLITRKKNTLLILLVLFGCLVFLGGTFGNSAEAKTAVVVYGVRVNSTDPYTDHSLTVNYSLDGNAYNRGDTLTATMSISQTACANTIPSSMSSIAFPVYSGNMILTYADYQNLDNVGLASTSLSGLIVDSAGLNQFYYVGFQFYDNRCYPSNVYPNECEGNSLFQGQIPYLVSCAYGSCLNSANTCSTDTFIDDCGSTCQGTKNCTAACVPNCNDAPSYCTGVPFADSCGTANACTGSQNCTSTCSPTCGAWSPWSICR